MNTETPLDRRAFVGALVLAQLSTSWHARSPYETVAEARERLARCALDIADRFLLLVDADPEGKMPPLGVPCPNQTVTLDPPF